MKEVIDRNFDLRREIWGDQALGGEDGENIRMITVRFFIILLYGRLLESTEWLLNSVDQEELL